MLANDTHVFGFRFLRFVFYFTSFVLLAFVCNYNIINFWFALFIFVFPRWVDDLRSISSPVWEDHAAKLTIKVILGSLLAIVVFVGLSGNLVDACFRLASMFVASGYVFVDVFDLFYTLMKRADTQKSFK